MNKSSPNAIVNDFVEATQNALGDWESIDAALGKQDLRLRRRVASDAFFALAVSWEVFFSDWLIAAVNKDSSRAAQNLSDQLEQYAIRELGVPKSHVAATLITQSHFNMDSARAILDSKDANIVLREYADLRKHAERWLAGDYRQTLLNIRKFEFKSVLAMRLVRNALAHQSPAALSRANDELRSNRMPVELRVTIKGQLTADGWRRYLLTTGGPRPKIALYHDKIAAVAGSLEVT
ncbi:hypothetical protein [Glycomyces buryatensis]|uniref:RiboL-PSP-HEPN domain-containing protein n=1 Tax=Glycomyces buryatensis TaxID=2570927 RepID=A0A4S8QK52_9ACTN|nr:hypothetical protein [Glycomyces buryatensis]THV41799.1 hypothetical protein FAB82_09540 [Glycomyces buryatensis]